ncbi:MAG TPA: 5'/3'-nucleotidase SurE [Anaerolineaceae bacterium]|nr:5'/3'-nucleotidase SurE [Anaerolineaceae bacterium]
MTHILVTNDDGIFAPGIVQLAKSLTKFSKVTVLAPDKNWSISGHKKTLHKPLRIRNVNLFEGVDAYSSDGAPSDCVALGLLGFIKEKIDLVVSGINPHANIGNDVTYSGTVTAAFEASIAGIPAIAFSLDSPENFLGDLDYSTAGEIAKSVSVRVIENGLPPKTILSVNIPYLRMDEIKGYQITKQGLRIYRDELISRKDPRGVPYYWIGGEFPHAVPDHGTDYGALKEGFVSITPLQLDMTAYSLFEYLNQWKM